MVLLIGGAARSGTTMLWRLCNGHPDIRLTYEFGNFAPLGRPYAAYRREMFRHHRRRGWYANRVLGLRETVSRFQHAADILRGYGFLGRYYLALSRYRGRTVDLAAIESVLRRRNSLGDAKFVGDKFPDYVSLLPGFTRERGVSFVAIYRDCRDVVSSTLKRVRAEWQGDAFARDFNTADAIAARWVEAVEQMELHADKIWHIRYEDLIHQPEPTLKGLGDWLGVDPTGFPRRLIRGGSIGLHQHGLSPEELAVVQEVAGPTLERLGYS